MSNKETDKRPIFNRLVPSVVIKDIDADRTMPQIGATLEVRFQDHEPQTVWLTAGAWEGAAVLIRQTPGHLRESVSTFLSVLHSCLVVGQPLEVFMGELIDEVRHDPYGEMPQTPLDTHNFAW